MNYEQATAIKDLLGAAQSVLIVQADNPDGDSLASALALEQIIGDIGKQPYLYCGVDIPTYLTHMAGWDRVSKELPAKFDISIIVDTSADSLLEILELSGQKHWLKSKPSIVLDHHATEASLTWATVLCIQTAVATGEIIYELAQQLEWPLNHETRELIASSILSDSLGLTSQATTARPIHIIAELVAAGVSIAELENRRREMQRKSPEILAYKGELLQRVSYDDSSRVAMVMIPWSEIERYSHSYNPSVLVLEEMRLVEGVSVAIAFKVYKDGKVTGKVRANYGSPVARELAEHFGGGGHAYASGFKITDKRPVADIKAACIGKANELLDTLDEG